MRTITLEDPGRFVASETPGPGAPGPGEALVQVRRIGVCGTDYHAFRGRQPFFTYPRILGHELGVEVMEVNGDGEARIGPGDRCAVEPYLNCGECIACLRGKPNCCVNLKVLGVHVDGGMRERFRVPLNKLHRSDSLSFDQLALVETLGIGQHAVDRGKVSDREHVLVIGAGPIGLAVTQFARLSGGHVTVMDINESRLAFSRRMGAESTIVAGEDALKQVEDLTNGDLPTIVFDATGSPESMQRAFQFVAHGGRLVFVGLFQGDVAFHDPHFHRREMTLLSSRNSTPGNFTRIIKLMEGGMIDIAPWITHRAPFDTFIDRFPAWLSPDTGVVKGIVDVEE
jgi:2-desacetyl-2-hydroxyethyl bacteriochlorophyllide A dehydrogenase